MIQIKMAKMQIADIPEVAEIERICFSQPWSEDGFRTALEQDYAFYLVARLEKSEQGEDCESWNVSDWNSGEGADRELIMDGQISCGRNEDSQDMSVPSEKGWSRSRPSKDSLVSGTPIVGYCGLLQSFEEAEILNVAVRPQSRGRGVAGAMLRQLMKIGHERGIERFILEVRKSNAAAIHLYEKAGFAIDGVRKNFYEKPQEDAVIMSSFGNISR